ITVNKAGQALDAARYYSSSGAPTTVRCTGGKATGHTLSSLLADHHNTATTSVDMAVGQAVTRRKSDPYGNPRGAEPGNWPGSRTSLGTGIDDTNTALTHIGAREYESATGRFISVDPIIDITDPMQMNGYTYSNGNPISYSDPTGLRTDDGTGHDEKPDGSSPANPWTPGATHRDGSDTKIGDGSGSTRTGKTLTIQPTPPSRLSPQGKRAWVEAIKFIKSKAVFLGNGAETKAGVANVSEMFWEHFCQAAAEECPTERPAAEGVGSFGLRVEDTGLGYRLGSQASTASLEGLTAAAAMKLLLTPEH
ncbi:RHS repeat-associated core domain-containing protein, partial [Streptomyces sp. NPDC059389]|uniref:RHS repeat-associated core domain-containing protein n=1 Tax=Streptomyces sp. NPDC059389 TaxID=3346818 RepID=UPI00367E2558